jgi:hypothetical protein
MDMIMQLTAFRGYYPVDQEISDIPLNFWYVLQETLFDNGIIPVRRHNSALRDGDDDLSLDANTSSEQLLWTQHCGETAVILYQQLVTVIKQKAIFPEDEIWQSWTKGKTWKEYGRRTHSVNLIRSQGQIPDMPP